MEPQADRAADRARSFLGAHDEAPPPGRCLYKPRRCLKRACTGLLYGLVQGRSGGRRARSTAAGIGRGAAITAEVG